MHYFVVEEVAPGEFERDIEHDETCCLVDKEAQDGYSWAEWDCDVGQHVSWWGYVDFEDDERYTTPGKYPIDFYAYWSGSMFDDSEAYCFFVEDNGT